MFAWKRRRIMYMATFSNARVSAGVLGHLHISNDHAHCEGAHGGTPPSSSCCDTPFVPFVPPRPFLALPCRRWHRPVCLKKFYTSAVYVQPVHTSFQGVCCMPTSPFPTIPTYGHTSSTQSASRTAVSGVSCFFPLVRSDRLICF